MKLFFPLALLTLLLIPSDAFAQFGPIVPEVCRTCACGFGGVMAIIQNLVNFIIAIAIIFATIILAWGGGLYILSPMNPESRSTANKMLINAVIGIVVVLSAWLIVDFVMKTLYGGQFGPWNSILYDSRGEVASCLTAKENNPLFSGNILAVPGPGGGGGSGSNCPVPDESTMVSFPNSVLVGGSGKATQATVDNFMRMRQEALGAGIDLKVTSAYRSDARQVELWNNRGANQDVARPCSLGGGGSNHNSGEAVDINVGCSNGQSNCNTPAYNWLKTNGGRYGFRNALPNDPVHWSPSGR